MWSLTASMAGFCQVPVSCACVAPKDKQEHAGKTTAQAQQRVIIVIKKCIEFACKIKASTLMPKV